MILMEHLQANIMPIHGRLCGAYAPWWRDAEPGTDDPSVAVRSSSPDTLDADAYAAGRQNYLAQDPARRQAAERAAKSQKS